MGELRKLVLSYFHQNERHLLTILAFYFGFLNKQLYKNTQQATVPKLPLQSEAFRVCAQHGI